MSIVLRAATRLLAVDTSYNMNEHDGVRTMHRRYEALDHKSAIVIRTAIPGVFIEAYYPRSFVNTEYYAFLVRGRTHMPENVLGYVRFIKTYAVRGLIGSAFTPHSYIKAQARGRSYMSSLYTWFLDAGNILVSSEAHTPAAAALWQGLARRWETVFYDTETESITAPDYDSKEIRMLLLGKGWTADKVERKLGVYAGLEVDDLEIGEPIRKSKRSPNDVVPPVQPAFAKHKRKG